MYILKLYDENETKLHLHEAGVDNSTVDTVPNSLTLSTTAEI